MNIGDIVRFEEGQFFNGAVQLNWVLDKPDLARDVARAFVFHGPRYHGAARAEQDGIEGAYRLKDTASFVRDLLEVMGTAEQGREVNPYWLAVAGYGSGKSHLSVAIAALLGAPHSETAAEVLAQVHSADAEIGVDLQGRLAGLGKPVLVLPLDGSKGFHLGTALSRVIFRQLADAGVDADAVRALSPRFQTATQFIERNFSFRADAFARVLPRLDAAAICAALRDQDEDVFDAVNAVYLEANGHSIPIEGQESAQDLIATLARFYCAEDGPFAHVLVLFDELGLYLEHAADHPERAGARVLQEIFQGIQDNSSRAHFVGFIQYELKSYLKRFGSSDLKHLQRYVTRFDGATKWYLSTNLETLFARLMRKDEAALYALWEAAKPQSEGRQTWLRLSTALPGFDRVSVWNDQDQFAQVIHRGCWPLHPFAVWFLTRQRDLVQQRSALAFVKDVTERLRDQATLQNGRLRQVSAASLVLDYMLSDLVAAEQGSGGAIAETLQTLLNKHGATLNHSQRMVLAGIAVLDKAHVGPHLRDTVDALLCEATTLDGAALRATLGTLSVLGTAEWNQDLQRYELLSDGASRAQFEHWLRSQRQILSADDIRQLFVRRGAADCALAEVGTDFDRTHDIRTKDWFFDARPGHVGIVDNLIRQAVDEWQKATLPTDAKGKLVYVYLHVEDDALAAEQRVDACLDGEIKRTGLERGPIWVVFIDDRHGRMAEHLARLAILDERASAAEQESFRRFIPDEVERSRAALRGAVEDALRERRWRVAGFSEPPAARLSVAAREIFSAIYPDVLPFPFDGFSTANGGGARDAIAVTKALIAGSVNYPWIQAQPTQLRNRVQAILDQGWQALSASGEPVVPRVPKVKALFQTLEQQHQRDPARTLLASYRQLIAPPYGMNASSAAILLGLMLGLRHPQRAVDCYGQQVVPADWMARAFSNRPGRYHFDEAALGAATLRFFDGDLEAEWRTFLDNWDAVERYDLCVAHARTAAQMLAIKPLPPSLAVDYHRLRLDAEQATVRLAELRHGINKWDHEIQRAHIQKSVPHALRYGAKVAQQANQMQASAYWPPKLVEECLVLANLAREIVVSEFATWAPRQNCHSAQQVGEFRQNVDGEAKCLEVLGFSAEAAKLRAQAQRSIARVEVLQRHTLTLAKCEDYPRQPGPTATTAVLALRDEVRQGESLIASLQAIAALSPEEKAAYSLAVKGRQACLTEAIRQREAELGTLDSLQIHSQEDLRTAVIAVDRLRNLFAGLRDEDQIKDLATLLQRILSDVQAWEDSSMSVERLAEILDHQATHQLNILLGWLEQEEIEPPPQWDLDAVYRALIAERVAIARRRSADWLRPRIELKQSIAGLGRTACAALEVELAAVPAYLSEADLEGATQLLTAVRRRLEELDSVERAARIARWQGPYMAIHDFAALDRSTTEQHIFALDAPPCPLLAAEQAWQREIRNCLMARLDQLGIDDLVVRIEHLSPPMRRALFERLARLMTC